jgi:hypothetical protein
LSEVHFQIPEISDEFAYLSGFVSVASKTLVDETGFQKKINNEKYK